MAANPGGDRVRAALASIRHSLPPGSPQRSVLAHMPAILMALGALVTAIATGMAHPAPPPPTGNKALQELSALRECLRARARAERTYKRLIGSALGDPLGIRARGLNPDPVVWASNSVGPPPTWATNYEFVTMPEECLREPGDRGPTYLPAE
jgi:hypothetical protein